MRFTGIYNYYYQGIGGGGNLAESDFDITIETTVDTSVRELMELVKQTIEHDRLYVNEFIEFKIEIVQICK